MLLPFRQLEPLCRGDRQAEIKPTRHMFHRLARDLALLGERGRSTCLNPGAQGALLNARAVDVLTTAARTRWQLPDCTRKRPPLLADQPAPADPFPYLWKVRLPHVGAVVISHA
jgi:hypothetical protein